MHFCCVRITQKIANKIACILIPNPFPECVKLATSGKATIHYIWNIGLHLWKYSSCYKINWIEIIVLLQTCKLSFVARFLRHLHHYLANLNHSLSITFFEISNFRFVFAIYPVNLCLLYFTYLFTSLSKTSFNSWFLW